jgi:hypothetical protein
MIGENSIPDFTSDPIIMSSLEILGIEFMSSILMSSSIL